MNEQQPTPAVLDSRQRLLTLEHLLALPAVDTKAALDQVRDLLSKVMQADKIDLFIFSPAENSLVALDVNATPMGARQQALGLDRLPLANGGREAEVYCNGQPYLSGNVDLDAGVLRGFRYELGIRSMIIVPLDVDDQRWGVIQVTSARAEAFTSQDVVFMQAVAHWIGMIVHRTRLVENLTASTAEQARQGAADELITMLAHELNNYLTPIQGRVALLRRRAAREDRQSDLADLNALSTAIARLGGLVNDLLTMARLEQGLFTINPQATDLGTVTQECVQTFNTHQTPIELHLADPGELTVLADPPRLRQVLENLLANAIKHSPSGTVVQVYVDTEQQAAGRAATVVVRDQGPGVPAALVPRLFTRFARDANSDGMGLGLFMARRLAEVHSGSLTYAPSDGGGASFRLALPLVASAPGAQPGVREPYPVQEQRSAVDATL